MTLRITPITRRRAVTLGVAVLTAPLAAQAYAAFGPPRPVTLRGYDGGAMEPFLSRDGAVLVFNTPNDPGVNTDLHWATRIDDLTFAWRGPIAGINTPALEGVASMDRNGRFYFVSNRSYDRTFSTLYRGRFRDGRVDGVELVPGVSRGQPGWVEFDAEISADGRRLYLVDSWFGPAGAPQSARIVVADQAGAGFAINPASAGLFATVNEAGLNYAPCTSADERELFFTRALPGLGPRIWRAARPSPDTPFGPAQPLAALTGFVEGPTIAPDGRRLYYHAKVDGGFVLRCVERA